MDASVHGILATITLVIVMPELNTKVVVMVHHGSPQRQLLPPSPINTAKALAVWSATQRTIMIESPAEVPLMNTSESQAASQLMRTNKERRVAH